MAETRQGRLRVKPGDWAPRLEVVEPGGATRRVRAADLVTDLSELPRAELDGIEVDFEYRGGQVRRVRRRGAPMPERQAPAVPAGGEAPGVGLAAQRARQADGPVVDRFNNPYTFVPTPARPADGHALADARPPGHHRIRPEYWSGRLTVSITAETPLLLTDPALAEPFGRTGPERDHLVLPVRLRPGTEEPWLAPTAVKGMLRSSFEAATNSRFGVFADHDARLAYRMPATEGVKGVPARISGDGQGIELLPGTTPVGRQGARPQEVLHAAWLPRYPPRRALRYPGGALPAHGDPVEGWAELVQHHRWDGRAGRHRADFRYWAMRSVVPAESGLPPAPGASQPEVAQDRRSFHEPLGTVRPVAGWAWIANQNISRKHDERVFFSDVPGGSPRHQLTPPLRQAWRELVQSYRDAHREQEISGRRDEHGQVAGPDRYLGPAPGKTAWSRHLYEANAEELQAGDLVFARVDPGGGVERLYPVMIGRDLFGVAPSALLDESIRPASRLNELSPADRVFGWVRNDKGRDAAVGSAYRGHLRVGPTVCLGLASGDPAIEHFDPPLPLSILGSPKPQQARFYLAAGPKGRPEPLPRGIAKSDWFVPGRQSLRGRKAYPHHAGLPDDYWKDPFTHRTQVVSNGRFQEYRRPWKEVNVGERQPPGLTPESTAFATVDGAEQLDDQNRSVSGWVKQGVTFEAVVEATNISAVEMGALLWLLTLPDGPFHRLGLGKPLGFGSAQVRLVLERSEVRRGNLVIDDYRVLGRRPEPTGMSQADADALRNEYQSAVAETYGEPFERVPFIRAILDVAAGDPSVPVHYPRVRVQGMRRDTPVPPDPRGQAFAWFVENERPENRQLARGHSLPAPGDDGLEVFTIEPR